MANFYHGVTQAEVEAAFPEAHDLHQAAALLLGAPRSEEQGRVMYRASGNWGYRLSFTPSPFGHLAFELEESEGTGNRGYIKIVAGTAAVRREMRRMLNMVTKKK